MSWTSPTTGASGGSASAARQGGVGTTTYIAGRPVDAGTGGILDGMAPFTLDDSAGSARRSSRRRTRRRACPEPRPKAPTRLRNDLEHAADATQRPFRQERVEADYAGQTTANGGAIISTRDSVSLGFGLEQVSGTAPARARAPDAAAPAADGRRHDRADGHVAAAGRERDGQRRRPGRDRGRGRATSAATSRRSACSVDGELVQRKVSFPFQLRWYPAAGDIGQTKTLSVDGRGQGRQRHHARRAPSRSARPTAIEESPLPTGVTTFTGTPVVGETLTCVPSGFSGTACTLTYEWLRDGARRSPARRARATSRRTPTSAREVSLPCHRDQQRAATPTPRRTRSR